MLKEELQLLALIMSFEMRIICALIFGAIDFVRSSHLDFIFINIKANIATRT